MRHGDQLHGIVAAWIRARDFDEVMTVFQEAGAAIAPILDAKQLVNDPEKLVDRVFTAGADAVMLDLEAAVPARCQRAGATDGRRRARRAPGMGP